MNRLPLVMVILAGCEPDLDGTAFKCDADHGCPLDQSCISGRCRRVAPTGIDCGTASCGPDEMCCADVINGNRCILATEVCPGNSALCDGTDDCAAAERCCNAQGGGDVTACALSCESKDVACTVDADCPSDALHCCPQVLVPWGQCSIFDC
ncbi:MAG: hypothetical protein H0V17_33495 [Deltaproteobacteria bacterium]|nr:hypothetical protein [Deltaproteobacteria bacterium]